MQKIKSLSAFMLLSALIITNAFAKKETKVNGCLASGCHDDLKKSKYLHKPIQATEHGVCHYLGNKNKPKDTSTKELAHLNLVKFDVNKTNALCLKCHEEIQEFLKQPKNAHKKLVEKACTHCHDAHGSTDKKLFKTDLFKVKCFSCHEKLKKNIDSAETHHSPVTDEKTCLNCHTVHRKKNEKLLSKSVEKVCQDCHANKVTLSDGRELQNIVQAMKTAKMVHKPVKGKCYSCHPPHGSGGAHLLENTIPKEFYQKFEAEKYTLCLDCHAPEIANAQKTEETEFRNGSQNLHYLHIQRGDKGFGCLTCHDPHTANQEKLIRDSYPAVGGVLEKMQFTKTASGGTCATQCHKEFKYDREKPEKK